jgi:hypothetical protein
MTWLELENNVKLTEILPVGLFFQFHLRMSGGQNGFYQCGKIGLLVLQWLDSAIVVKSLFLCENARPFRIGTL